MSINRHNYEEFFILYWDDELTTSQKQAVENFVKENSDLQEEFKILGETRFTPDATVQFEEKEFLQNKPFINITNYEEQLLNYIDDELSNDERKEVERSAAKYPTIQKELALLQKTKLRPEAEVVFPDRSTLYRREEKVRIISMTWFRVAVAAVIILVAGFVILKLVNTNKNGNNPDVAEINKIKEQPSNNITEPPVTQPKDKLEKDKGQSLAATNDKSTTEQKTKNPDIKNPIKQNKTSTPLIAYKPENKNNLPKRNIQQANQNATTDGVIADADFNLKKDNSTAQKNNSDIVNTSFDNSDVTLQDKLTLHIPKIKDKEKDGGGLKEFLRKTTRVFERRTKIQTTTDDNKLLLGAFAVSLK
jgi:hypothetical protein